MTAHFDETLRRAATQATQIMIAAQAAKRPRESRDETVEREPVAHEPGERCRYLALRADDQARRPRSGRPCEGWFQTRPEPANAGSNVATVTAGAAGTASRHCPAAPARTAAHQQRNQSDKARRPPLATANESGDAEARAREPDECVAGAERVGGNRWKQTEARDVQKDRVFMASREKAPRA
jgi:hypothetical protein